MAVYQCFSVGSAVRIGDTVQATVLAFKVGMNGVESYHVVWWDENSRKTDWLEPMEVHKTDASRSMKMGFGTGE